MSGLPAEIIEVEEKRIIKDNKINVNIEGLEILCRSTQDELLKYLGKTLPEIYGKDNCDITKSYVFAKGTIPMCLVCHLDTVHNEQVDTFWYDKKKGIVKSDEGVGGDDRCGVYASIAIMNHYGVKDKPSLLFTTDEEIGCIGAKAAATSLKDKVKDFKYLIEFDRKGSNDAVFYQTANDKFVEYIESFGFEKANGSVSDICSLSAEWGMASVNLSSGYYNAHTVREYININELAYNINRAINIIEDINNVEMFVYKDPSSVKSNVYSYNSFAYRNYENWDDYYDGCGYGGYTYSSYYNHEKNKSEKKKDGKKKLNQTHSNFDTYMYNTYSDRDRVMVDEYDAMDNFWIHPNTEGILIDKFNKCMV